jgi:hypothetical protein
VVVWCGCRHIEVLYQKMPKFAIGYAKKDPIANRRFSPL